jgi:CII-binding regulator of phage lambda lysogenization HflD
VGLGDRLRTGGRLRSRVARGGSQMSYQDDAVRAIIRAAGWRTMRALPLWVSIAVLFLALLFGHR